MGVSNLSDAEFKTLVIRMLQELIGYFKDIKKTQEEIKVALSEIKKNLQGTTVEKMMPRIKSKICNTGRKKHSIRLARRKRELKKNKDRLTNLWDIFKCTNI